MNLKYLSWVLLYLDGETKVARRNSDHIMLQVNNDRRYVEIMSEGSLGLVEKVGNVPSSAPVANDSRCLVYDSLGNFSTLDQCITGAAGRGYSYISYQLSSLRCSASATCNILETCAGWQVFMLPATTTDTTTMFINSPSLPVNSYGIWDRSNAYNQSARPFLKGWAAELKWSELQPTKGKFDFTNLDIALSKAHDAGGLFYAMVQVGPDSPEWIYNYTVRVTTQPDPDHPGFISYPYYLDSTYNTLRNRMIRVFATYLRNHSYAASIGFVQANFGCTGDAVLYKVPPVNQSYWIDDATAKSYMYDTWQVFKQAFQEGPGRVIPILINPMDEDDMAEESVAIATFGELGIKGSAYVRGHHLSGERSWIERHRKRLLNSSTLSSTQFIFARAEMDQTWLNPLYQINVKLGFYWGLINGLNQGLSVHDVSKGALDQCYDLGFADSFDFFNTYAPQVWPQNATSAFIALHEGLDALDLDKFPEGDTFGPKGRNVKRVTKICNAYSSFGCLVDDMDAAVLGQVYQRASQGGYNDVGYDIWPTNYGRWLEQLDADATSQGLFRIGGRIKASTSKYARFARGLIHSTNKTGMYFKFSDGFFTNVPGQLNFNLVWYDNVAGSFQVKYTSQSLKRKVALDLVCSGSKIWKSARFNIASLGSRLHTRGSDFSITSSTSTDIIVHLIEVSRVV